MSITLNFLRRELSECQELVTKAIEENNNDNKIYNEAQCDIIRATINLLEVELRENKILCRE